MPPPPPPAASLSLLKQAAAEQSLAGLALQRRSGKQIEKTKLEREVSG